MGAGQLTPMRTYPTLFAAVLLGLVSPGSFAQSQPTPSPKTAEGAVAAEEEIGKIEGIEVARPGGGFLGLLVEGVTVKITFYDDKKKPVVADAVRISARWHDTKPRKAVLLPSTPETLVSPGVFPRRHTYIVFFTLIGPDDQVIESFSKRLNEAPAGEGEATDAGATPGAGSDGF